MNRDRYSAELETEGDPTAVKWFPSFAEAERQARRWVREVPTRSGRVRIYGDMQPLAIIRADALDRVWTELCDGDAGAVKLAGI